MCFRFPRPKIFDFGNYPKDQTRLVTFPVPGIVLVYCHLHPNMAATIVVTPNGYAARADESGKFTFSGLPAGTYTLVAWHKAAGFFRKAVSVDGSRERRRGVLHSLCGSGGDGRGAGKIMRLGARTFLWFFVPVTVLLTGSFWSIQRQTLSTVYSRNAGIAAPKSDPDRQNRGQAGGPRPASAGGDRFQSGAAGRRAVAAVRAGCGCQGDGGGPTSRDCRHAGSGFAGDLQPGWLASGRIQRRAGKLIAIRCRWRSRYRARLSGRWRCCLPHNFRPAQSGRRNVATLAAGEVFDLTQFGAPLVLARQGLDGTVVARGGAPAALFSRVMSGCSVGRECETRIAGELYLSAPIRIWALGEGYELRAMQNVDAAAKPVGDGLRWIFLTASMLAIAAAGIVSVVASRSIVKPITSLVAHLKASEKTGVLTRVQRPGGSSGDSRAD